MKEIVCVQYSPEWWLARKSVPTASKADAIVTPAKFEPSKQREAYACRLVAERFDKFYAQSPEFQTQATDEGHQLEPEARRYVEFHRGYKVREIGFAMTDDERFGCSPDGLIDSEGVLELKCPQPHTHVRYLVDGVLPNEYAPQCHMHLIVTGRQWVDFMSYAPGLPPLLVRVEPNEKTELLRKGLDEFWDLYQTILSRVEAKHAEYVDSEIDRRKDEPTKQMRSFVA
jgi:hypothetical protein